MNKQCVLPTLDVLFKILTTQMPPMVRTAIIEYAHDRQEQIKAQQCTRLNGDNICTIIYETAIHY